MRKIFEQMAKLPYKNVNNGFKRVSAKGQVPFVELNGREIADSNQIIRELTKHFHVELDAKLSPRELADQRAYHSLIEDSLRWQEWYFRCTDTAYSGLLCSDEEGLGYALTPCQKTMTKYLMGPWTQREVSRRWNWNGLVWDVWLDFSTSSAAWQWALGVTVRKR